MRSKYLDSGMRGRVPALLGVATGMLAVGVLASDIDVLQMSQDKSRTVTVRYNLQIENAVVTVDFLTNGVSIGEENFLSLSGDVNRLVSGRGEHILCWKARADWPDHEITDGTFSAVVTAWQPTCRRTIWLLTLRVRRHRRTSFPRTHCPEE